MNSERRKEVRHKESCSSSNRPCGVDTLGAKARSLAMKVIELMDGIYTLKRQVPFMKLLKSLIAVFHAVSTKTDTTRRSLCALPYPLLVSKAETVTISWASHLELGVFRRGNLQLSIR